MVGAVGGNHVGHHAAAARAEDDHRANVVGWGKRRVGQPVRRRRERGDPLLGQGGGGLPHAQGVEVLRPGHPGAGPVERTPSRAALASRRSCSSSPTSVPSSTSITATPSTNR